ncbi:DEAD/DEAH box helicase [Micromonospora chalcea]|uniref:DEAD/DEAH box helicase n=1 Tax=Micromonospora TaxID=1873 RepID=UPI0033DDB3C1
MADLSGWENPDNTLQRWIDDQRASMLGSYRSTPRLIDEHGLQEDSFRTGGYAHRQVLELVQNGADALRRGGQRGRVVLLLRGDVLYCANEGAPFSQRGLEAVCHAYLSDKRGEDMGRFGLGFKSVLAVSDSPTILSRSVSFKFSADIARRSLEELAPNASVYPVLRLPFNADAQAEMAADPVLAELGTWAETVVRLPLARLSSRLEQELGAFPKEFLLFAPYVAELEISTEDTQKVFTCVPQEGSRQRLTSNGERPADWMVWHQSHRPSELALSEVSEAIRRPEVVVTYAVPLDTTQTLGRFWAYFPLQDSTSARGIHNAPWHISDDRTNMLPGRFNEELLEVVAELIVNAIPHLHTAGDPARHFDYMPARGREFDNFGDLRLTELVPRLAEVTTCVPDAEGTLRVPTDLEYPSAELRIGVESLELWSSASGRPLRSPHPACFRNATRRARLYRLVRGEAGRASRNELGAAEWLERLVSAGTDEQCDAALQVYMSIDDEAVRRAMSRAAIMPDVTGTLHRLDHTDRLYLRGNSLSAAAGIRLVRPSLLDRPGVEDSLRAIGFEDVDPAHELRRLAGAAANRWTAQQWEDFWALVLHVSIHDAEKILSDHFMKGMTLKVRCRDHSWQHAGTVVSPGLVDPMKPSLVIDTEFHGLPPRLLQAIGVVAQPRITPAVLADLTLLEYRRLQRSAYLETLSGRRPDASEIDFEEQEGPAPLHVLRGFTDSGDETSSVRWTRALLELETPAVWTLRHPNSKRFPPRTVTAPHLWAAQRYGLVDTTWGPRPAALSLHPDCEELSPMLPVAAWKATARLKCIPGKTDLPEAVWREFLCRRPTGGDHRQLGALVADAFERLPDDEVPDQVPAVKGMGHETVSPEQLLIAATDDEARALSELSLPFVTVDDQPLAQELIESWGCRSASSILRIEVVTESPGEPVVLLERFRRLRDYGADVLDGLDLISCGSLERVVILSAGTESTSLPFAVAGRNVYFDDSLDDEELLGHLSRHFDLGLDDQAIKRVLLEAESARIQAAIALSRAARDHAERLLALLPASTLTLRLPKELLDAVPLLDGADGDRQIADLLMHYHGDNVLHALRAELRDFGYEDVPDTWAGSALAVAFVRRLGFPAEFAGERDRGVDADTTVLGPPDLKPLHPYQERLAEQIRELLRPGVAPDRALLFLPTGAGKTRVTVEALTRSICAGDVAGPVLWVAQSQELCEQAAQTWTTVWRQFGNQPLRLCRLWSRNEVAATGHNASVVVATDAKLDKVRDRDEYEWLRKAAIVVVDEAHGAIAKGITATLRWLGIDHRKTARPLLGLTATPFAGTGPAANERLVNRFLGRQLDNGLGEDPYAELQRMGVLANVRHRVIKGFKYDFDPADKRHFETFGDLSKDLLKRVGGDRHRTLRLVEDIVAQPADWPILVFTSSVLAAQTLSALLRMQGIPSRAVSGSTPTPERRRAIESFRARETRVLANCNVLTQGFDAPGVRALYIARPTFSPNLYIQMVGRGLRGPENGGKPECDVVNVADTFDVFGERLAYKEFDHLWRYRGGDAE